MSASWKKPDNMLSKADAQEAIYKMAEEQGLKDTFKVFYDGKLIEDPANLPDRVDMNKVKVSELLHQA